MFNERELGIIQILIEAEMFVTGDFVAKELNISIKTLQKEIKYIRGILADYQIQIISQRGKGYLLKMESKLQSEIFLNSISYFSKNSVQEDYDGEFILLSVIKIIYIEHRSITLADFEEKMFVGRKYLKGKINLLKKKATGYGLKLSLRQGKGISLKGNSLQIQLLYMDLLETVNNRILYGEQFFIERNDKKMCELQRLCKLFNMHIPYSKVKKICLFLSIQENLKLLPLKDERKFSVFEKALLNSQFGEISGQMMRLYQLDTNTLLCLYLAELLLCSIEKYELEQYGDIISTISIIDSNKLIKTITLSIENSYDIFKYPTQKVAQIVGNILMVNLIEQRLYLQNKFTNIENLGGKTMLCEYITGRILHDVYQQYQITFSLDLLANIKLILRTLTIKFSEVNAQSMYIISKKDYTIAEYVAKNLEHEYVKFVYQIKALPEINERIRSTDIIVTDIPLDNFTEFSNVLFFTSLANYGEVRQSVGNYINLSSKKSKTFFECLNLSYLTPKNKSINFMRELRNTRGLGYYKLQLNNLDKIHHFYQIFTINNISVLILFNQQAEHNVEVIPIIHSKYLYWDDDRVKCTLIIKLNQLSDFISIDQPIFKIYTDESFQKFIKSNDNIGIENFEEELNSIIF